MTVVVVLVDKSCLTLWDPMGSALQASPSSTDSQTLFKFMYTKSLYESINTKNLLLMAISHLN